ncbi:MAG: hypothetical protein ACRDFZ_08340 [Candidatus Limnocylindria bacterium]
MAARSGRAYGQRVQMRRDALRAAGWLAIGLGLISVVLAIATDHVWADLAGGYGLPVALAGMWTVGGLGLLSRREHRMAQARTQRRTVPSRGALSR